jgi:hypothetical protein
MFGIIPADEDQLALGVQIIGIHNPQPWLARAPAAQPANPRTEKKTIEPKGNRQPDHKHQAIGHIIQKLAVSQEICHVKTLTFNGLEIQPQNTFNRSNKMFLP